MLIFLKMLFLFLEICGFSLHRTQVAYFDERTTSGVVEGINNKLKLIKRRAYGMRNFTNLKLRSFLTCILLFDFTY